MRRLMLLRHAKTENDAPSGRDQDRRLDDRGQQRRRRDRRLDRPPSAVSRCRAGFDRGPGAPDLGNRLGGDEGPRAASRRWNMLPELYGADPAQIAAKPSATRRRSDPQRLMVVGHNPGMHELALALAGSGDAAGRQGAGRQSADVGTCDLRLRDRRLGRCGIPPRTARAVCQSETAEADLRRLSAATRPPRRQT